MTSAENLIQEIRQITIQYKAEVGSHRKPWPASIRNRVEQLKSATGMTWRAVSEKTGIPYYTIMQWRQNEKKSPKRKFHALPVVPAKSDAKKVATVTVPIQRVQTATVTVTTPDGYRIQADDVNRIAELIAILRRGE